MPNTTDLRTPPELRGTADEKLQQLWSWLYQTVELLQIVINKDTGEKSVDNSGAVEQLSGTVSALNKAMGENEKNITQKIDDTVQQITKGFEQGIQDVTKDIDKLDKRFGDHAHDDMYAAKGHKHTVDDVTDLSVRYGTGQFNRTNYGDTTGIDVVFDEPFPYGVVPTVTMTVHYPLDRYGNMNEDLASCIALVEEGSVTNAGFKAWFCNGDDNEWFAPKFTYIAVADIGSD